jgi:DNA-binding NarL/FixJ family response regulator
LGGFRSATQDRAIQRERRRSTIGKMGEGVTFLVVEDDAPLARAFGRVIRRFGDVVCATTRVDAIHALEQPTPFAAMLVDARLPDGSGLDVLAAARAKPWLARVPALVMTAYLNESVTHRAVALDARFIAKPFEISLLDAYLHDVVTRQKAAASRRQATILRWQVAYRLTERQAELLREAAEGASREEIAVRWGVSTETVKKHAHEFLAKTSDKSLHDAAVRMLREATES